MKTGVARYVKIMRSLFVAFCVIAIPALMISLSLAVNLEDKALWICVSVAVALLFSSRTAFIP